ncbi:MAG: hypothetical protein JWN41_311 [Thermoleophilia bacterium]|nr:hypothetical protein [Thermoleophilia bacterium]
MIIAATWFLSRLLWDHVLRPSWRGNPAHKRKRFVCITVTGVVVAATGFGVVVSSFYGWLPGIIAGVCVVPIYVFMAFILQMLLKDFDVDIGSQ